MKVNLSYIFEDENEDETNENIDIVNLLRQFVRKQISTYKLEESDPFIAAIQEKFQRGQSIIVFDVSGDDFLEKLDISDDDIWFYKTITSSYNDFNFEDRSSVWDDFLEGYYGGVYRELDEDNFNLVKKIAKYMIPATEFSYDTEYLKKLNQKLNMFFNREIESLVDDFYYEQERAYSQSAANGVQEEFDEVLEQYGLSYDFYREEVSSIVAELVMTARLLNYSGNLEGLYNKMVEELSKKSMGGWYEDYYSYYDDKYFDKGSYNRTAYRILNKIEEKIEEDFDNDENTSRFLRFVDKITEKFRLNKQYVLPKNKEIRITIIGFDIEDLTVEVKITKEDGFSVKNKFKEEDFYNFLYHPELFNLEY
jgi:hypothetical protein